LICVTVGLRRSAENGHGFDGARFFHLSLNRSPEREKLLCGI